MFHYIDIDSVLFHRVASFRTRMFSLRYRPPRRRKLLIITVSNKTSCGIISNDIEFNFHSSGRTVSKLAAVRHRLPRRRKLSIITTVFNKTHLVLWYHFIRYRVQFQFIGSYCFQTRFRPIPSPSEVKANYCCRLKLIDVFNFTPADAIRYKLSSPTPATAAHLIGL